ncbi:Mov34/MPN/PAD-1 family protein [Cavenderia fasciculata]|uniref:Eukaryotic translation initiation factor 3 subunit F n=1 Tax=Cavenderia fasciculata TaxID=261658 RepID=F4QCC5_CACFS|nr:Mov34/MPN/PAD-1 family protein [Cavenderia fasciculata]EGG13560.1 Mov34/MPN/PAD-1 family protein [Cavenderia fasciculata]|eukprot:XP_004350264.1 Mov34/MPN/PAD-1 family protein [Cavenderia fasciculata]
MQGEKSIYLPSQNIIKVHPLVIFNILDHYIRRNEGQDRVIGTLLGFNNDGVIEIRNCFPVVHSEGDQIAVEMEFHRKMLDLHLKSSPREPIVGWYATGSDINENSVIINNFYREEMNGTPVHLTVDTGLTNDTMGIHAYQAHQLSTTSDSSLGSYFSPLPLEILSFDAENAGIDALTSNNSQLHQQPQQPQLQEGEQTTTEQTQEGEQQQQQPQQPQPQQSVSLLTELESLRGSLTKLDTMLDDVANYIEAVERGEIQGDPRIGRFLAKTIQSLPKSNTQVMDKVINNSVKDLLMIVYISSLTRSQLAVAEKLRQSLTF